MTDGERKEQKAARVAQAAEWLRSGMRSGAVATLLQERYGVSPRTAERDISRALKDYAEEIGRDWEEVRWRSSADLQWAALKAAEMAEDKSLEPRDRLRALSVMGQLIDQRAKLLRLYTMPAENGLSEETIRASVITALERDAHRFTDQDRKKIIAAMDGSTGDLTWQPWAERAS